MEANRLEQAGCPPPDAQASAVIGDPAVKEQTSSASRSQRAAAQRRRAAVARLLRMGVSDGAKSPSDAATTNELETELALLREENAQLKVERHRPADVGHVIERMRSLRLESPAGQPAGESPAATEAIAECLAVREGLMQACQEVQQAMQGIRGRLGALAGDIHNNNSPGDRSASDQLATPPVKTVDIESAVPVEASPEFAQSVA